MKKILFIPILFLFFYSCKEIQKVTDLVTNPSASKVFERSLKDDYLLFEQYEKLYANAKNNNLKLDLPAVVYSKSDSDSYSILAYTVSLKRGERFKIETDTDSLQFSIDVFSYDSDSNLFEKPILSNKPNTNYLEFEVPRNADYKVVIAPKNKNNTTYNIKLYSDPTILFPVSGKDNKAIKSFWGASRGGGKRKHEGIDIFAKRGTPVVASLDGIVTVTKNDGLGGKQVWMRANNPAYTLYYAHLDEIKVAEGKRVVVGDTLGFVGNTGNAKKASPHLHFGIYTSHGKGAVDPFPFVRDKYAPEITNENFLNTALTKLEKNELRIGTSSKDKKIQDLEIETPVIVLAKINKWFHIRVDGNVEGFMHESLFM